MLVNIGKTKDLTLISGPCAIESEKLSMSIAEYICEATNDLPISYIFKASFDTKCFNFSIETFSHS